MIKVYLGSMFSGKTSEMLDEIDRADIAGLKTLVVKFLGDTRYCDSSESKIVTHSKREYSGTIVSTANLSDLNDFIQRNDIKVIGIDEFQFMSSPQCIVDWASQDRDVYISALDGDYKQKIFDNVAYILPYSDEITKLRAVCMKCRKRDSAIFSWRISEEKERVVIGGSEKYIAICRHCLV